MGGLPIFSDTKPGVPAFVCMLAGRIVPIITFNYIEF